MMLMSNWAPMLMELSSTMTTMTRVQNLFQNGLFMMMKTGVVTLLANFVRIYMYRMRATKDDGCLGDDVLEGGGGDEENLGVIPALHPQCEVVVPDHVSAQPKWLRSSRTSKVPGQ